MLFFFKKLNFLIFNVLREKAEAFFFFFLFFSFQKELLRQRIKGLCTNELKSWIFGCVKAPGFDDRKLRNIRNME
ncbi:MAG: hypothetical protein A2Y28_00480 [Chlamydiae bacterium GWC2_50_10]|nr:MAG: hypothetical protein A2Y28_00480 [Chlamydiae bacterium GWC2_50_10]OGN73529.1 MAG: hypothetical protein A3G30_04835 [Chlamydiae bacterium RIFCSPLOWO2_12_FULL_49_12]HCJ83818.1 hypothetical protein [Parachlamydiales bacterium]